MDVRKKTDSIIIHCAATKKSMDIGYKEIKSLQKKNLFNIKFMPVFLGGLHNKAGVTPAAFNKFKSYSLLHFVILLPIVL